MLRLWWYLETLKKKNDVVPQRTLIVVYDWKNPYDELLNMNNEVSFHQRHLWAQIK